MSERKKFAVSTTVDLSKVTGGYGSIRDPFACPRCGGKMIAESLGMKCLNCKGILTAKGEFHEYVERPFMPPMRRIDKIKAMDTDAFVDWMVWEFPDIMEKCNNSFISLSKYFEEIETEDEHRT